MIYYHVAGPTYTEGNDLLSYRELEARGWAPVWKWGDWRLELEGCDDDIVCLFDTIGEAREFQSVFGGMIYAVELWDELRTVRNDEGYLGVLRRIPAECIMKVED